MAWVGFEEYPYLCENNCLEAQLAITYFWSLTLAASANKISSPLTLGFLLCAVNAGSCLLVCPDVIYCSVIPSGEVGGSACQT
eukprot:3012199-Amphidinium_carterae.1